MKTFFKNLGWALAFIFVAFYLGCRFLNIKMAAKEYKKNDDFYTLDERYKKVARIIKPYLFLKKIKWDDLSDIKIPDKPSLFVANHKSKFDPLVIFMYLHQKIQNRPIFVAKIELKSSKVAPILDLIDTIYLDRENLRDGIRCLKEQLKWLHDHKRSIIIFPEGTRVTDHNSFNDFKPGAFELIKKEYCPINPIVLVNSDFLTNKNYKKVNGFNHIGIYSLPTYNPTDYINVDKIIFVKNLEKRMLNKYKELLEKIEK